MASDHFFELHGWGLKTIEARKFASLVFAHSKAPGGMDVPACWPSKLVDPCHLFACGKARVGTMENSRLLLSALLESKANLNAIDSSGWTPLCYSSWFGLAGTTSLLIEAGADVNFEYAPKPLAVALSSYAQRKSQGASTCAKLLVMSGADPRKCSISDPSGRSSFLSWAVASSNFEWAEILHGKGDFIRNEREFATLLFDADIASLDWLERHGYDVLSRLSEDHEHWRALMEERAKRRRFFLHGLTGKPMNKVCEEDEEDYRKM